MLGDDVSRPSEYGRKREKHLDPSIFYKKFEIGYDLIVSDHLVEGYLNLLEIFREIKDDDHADEFTKETNWQATDRNHREGGQYEDTLLSDVQDYAVSEMESPLEEPKINEVAA